MFGDCSANPNRTREAADEDPVLLLLGTSTPTREIARALNSLAQCDINLLIQGEPGTGKPEGVGGPSLSLRGALGPRIAISRGSER